jgi:DNA-directed RNA polymerase subunit omega
VLVAKERATQLNSGIEPTLDKDNDKNTVISLREIAEEKIKVSDLTDSAIYKLRKHVEQVDDGSEDDEEVGDDFENMYKGEISKSGTPILPSKRARKTPEKIQVSQEDLAELSETAKPDVDVTANEETINEQGEVSLDEVSEQENQKEEAIKEDLAELSETAKPDIDLSVEEETMSEQGEVSLDEVSEQENLDQEVNSEDSDSSNS